MSTGKVGVIRKIDPGMASQAALIGLSGLYGANTMYQGSGSQRRNQQRLKAAQAEARQFGRGVKRVAQLPGRAAQGVAQLPGRAAQGVKRLGYELSGGPWELKPGENQGPNADWYEGEAHGLWTPRRPGGALNPQPSQARWLPEAYAQAPSQGTVGVQSR